MEEHKKNCANSKSVKYALQTLSKSLILENDHDQLTFGSTCSGLMLVLKIESMSRLENKEYIIY